MRINVNRVRDWGLLGVAAVAGCAISAVENFAFQGEISPIVIVALLLLASGSLGLAVGMRRWWCAVAVWFWIPAAHVVKHILGLADTLHPNTYASIAALAAFTLVVCGIGLCAGAAIRRTVVSPATGMQAR
jgi:hypothetical protein